MRIPVVLGVVLFGAATIALACSSGPAPGGTGGTTGAAGTAGTGGSAGTGGTSGNGGTMGRGVMGGGSAGSGGSADKNPYGIPYPTNNVGTTARVGNVAGSQISNFCFLGFANSKQGQPTVDTGSPTTICLSDFYDPENKTYKELHISVAAEWCGPCNEETDEVTAGAATLASKGAVFIQALTEGYTVGTAAMVSDLQSWIPSKTAAEGGPRGAVNYNMVLDPELMNLGVFTTESSIPWNCDIDVRTMEILYRDNGYDMHEVSDIEGYVTWVENNPPSYTCPTGTKLSGKSCVAAK